MLTATELQSYLERHIPLSLAMGVTVREAGADGVILCAPLEPNINHRDTVFGGSAAAVAILAAWSLLHIRLLDAGISRRLVIQRSSMHYERPITGAFTARSLVPEPDTWQLFVRTLDRRGRARISVSAILEQDGRTAGRLDGDFAALGA